MSSTPSLTSLKRFGPTFDLPVVPAYARRMTSDFLSAGPRHLVALVALGIAACTPATAPESGAPVASSAPATARSACAPWGGRGFSLTARSQSSHALQFRQFVYDDTSGKLTVSDSDLFASGKEEKTPRVIERTLTLSPKDHEAVTADLLAICPDAKSMIIESAPGGGTTVEIRPRAGDAATVRSVASGGKVMDRFTPFFPELRTN